MDDKLFDIFSEETDVPECVRRRVDETLEMIEDSAGSDKAYRQEEQTGRGINGTVENQNTGTKKIYSLESNENAGKKNEGRRRNKKKNWKRSLILTFAAVLAFGATVFAAEKYMGISSFFLSDGKQMPQEAQELVEKAPMQQEDGDSILTYTVKEALCDRNSVQVVIEAMAKERGKYLLIGSDLSEEDMVRELGIESDKTIADYANDKGLTVVKVGASFDYNSDLGIISTVRQYQAEEDDVLYIYSSAKKENKSGSLMVSCVGTAMLPDAQNGEEVMRTNITFQMEDKSQDTCVTYVPEEGEEDTSAADGEAGVVTADGKIKILSVDVEQTEIANYVSVHYILLNGEYHFFLEATDAEGNPWTWSNIGSGGSPEPEAGRESVWNLTYEKTELTDEIGIFAYDYENDVTYETVRMKLQK